MSNEIETSQHSSQEQLPNSSAETVIKLGANESIHYDGKHYDQIYENYLIAPTQEKDFLFWIDLATQYGDPVLELCCGTGRLTIPIAEKGFQVTGLDNSESMLAQARQKSSQVQWVNADVQNFQLNQQFSLIFFPVNSFWHLPNLAAVEACFASVKKHLKPNGKFVIDVLNPCNLEFLKALSEPRRHLYSIYANPQSQGTVVVTCFNEFDFTAQIYTQKLFFKLVEQGKEMVEETKYRLYFPQELTALLKYNGFVIENTFGWYDKTPFSATSPQQLIICSVEN